MTCPKCAAPLFVVSGDNVFPCGRRPFLSYSSRAGITLKMDCLRCRRKVTIPDVVRKMEEALKGGGDAEND